MRTDVLHNFVVLANEKSMTKAAKQLHISQPTLSRQMSALEEDLGKQLYNREDGVIKLTANGRILYDYAISIIELESRARQDIAYSDGQVSGLVYIGCGGTSAMTYVCQAVIDVQKRYPNIEFNLVSGDTSTLIEKLNQGSIDFMLECDLKNRGRYNTMVLPGHDTICMVVGPKSTLYDLESVTPSDLVQANVVASRQLLGGSLMREWAGDEYTSIRPSVFFDLGTGTIELAITGTACILAYQEVAEPMCAGTPLRCIPMDPPIFDVCGLVWRKNRKLSHAAQVFLETLLRVCEQA